MSGSQVAGSAVVTLPVRRVDGGSLLLLPAGDRAFWVETPTGTARSEALPQRSLRSAWAEAAMSPRSVLLGAALATSGTRHDLDSTDATALVHEAEAGRVIPLLAAAVRSGALNVPDATGRQIAKANRQVQETSLYIERSANRAIQALTAAGLTPIVIKGLASAHLDYPDSCLRQIGDVDLLVGPDDLTMAEQTLTAEGYTAQTRSRHSLVTKSVVLRNPDEIEIDLHRLPTFLPYGGWVLDTPVSFETVTVSTVPWTVLTRPDRFVLAVVHYVLSARGYRRLSSAVDALALWPDEPDAEAFAEAIERWRAPTLVAVFTRLMEIGFGLALPCIPGCSTDRARWFERELLATGWAGIISNHFGPLAALPTRDALGELARIVFPDRNYMEHSPHSSWARRLAHGVRSTLRSLQR